MGRVLVVASMIYIVSGGSFFALRGLSSCATQVQQLQLTGFVAPHHVDFSSLTRDRESSSPAEWDA